jgi:hypothetical protein
MNRPLDDVNGWKRPRSGQRGASTIQRGVGNVAQPKWLSHERKLRLSPVNACNGKRKVFINFGAEFVTEYFQYHA